MLKMKKLFLVLLSIVSVNYVQAQCENSYFPFSEGVKMEMTSYNKKDKEQGKSVSEVIAFEGNKATIKSTIFDKKGEQVSDGSFEVICENGTVKMDFKNFVPEELLSQYENMEVTIEGDFISIPSSLEVGQELADGSGKMIIDISGGAGVSMKNTINMNFTDRKVSAKESITTPAGTFETYRIDQKMVTEVEIMGMSRTTETTSSSWYANGVGAVKTENYDNSGKLSNYSLLTDYSK